MQSQGTNIIYISAGSRRGRRGARRGGFGFDAHAGGRSGDRPDPDRGADEPSARNRAQVVAGNQNWSTRSRAATRIRRHPQLGHPFRLNFTAREVLTADKVCLIGESVRRALFPDQDPVAK